MGLIKDLIFKYDRWIASTYCEQPKCKQGIIYWKSRMVTCNKTGKPCAESECEYK